MSKSVTENGYYGVIVLIFIIFLILLICWLFVVWIPVSPLPNPNLKNVGYGSRCIIDGVDPSQDDIDSFNPGNCGTGLTCVRYSNDVDWGICKTSIGAPCNNLSQCVPNAAVCSTVCSITQTGGLNQSAPCNQGLSPNKDGICKYDVGQEGCVTSSDCTSNSCLATINSDGSVIKVCNALQIDGSLCNTNIDCLSGNCSTLYNINGPVGNFCQPVGTNSGDVGAACGIGINIPNCSDGYACYKDITNTIDEYGTCQVEVSEWPSYCTNNNPCLSPSICWNGDCVMPRTNTEYKTNYCGIKTTGTCITGYLCGNDSVCNPISTAPYPSIGLDGNYKKWYMFKWIPSTTEVGYWSPIIQIQNTPISGVNLSCTSNLAIYSNSSGWTLINTNTLKITQIKVTYNFEVAGKTVYNTSYNIDTNNITFTPNSGILVSYTLNSKIDGSFIYRSYLYSQIPSSFVESGSLEIQVYSLTSYYNTLQTCITIDDKVYGNSIRMLVVRPNGSTTSLYTALTTIDEINGVRNSTSTKTPNLILQVNGAVWGGFYAYNQLNADTSEYVYKDTAGTQIYVHTLTGNTNSVTIPPVTTVPSTGSKIINQYINSMNNSGFSQVKMIYTINYPATSGGPQLRFIENGQDVIVPGYFTADTNIQLSISYDTNDFYVITPSY